MNNVERNQMLPGASVRVVNPDAEHHAYQDDFGMIVDVRDYGDQRFCQVDLQQSRQLIFFAFTELQLIPSS